MSSIVKDIDRYVSLDLETTGYDPDFDDVIECAAIRYVNGNETERFHSFVSWPDAELDPYITELTGITDDMLSGAPCLSEIVPRLVEFIGDDIILGHNLAFDLAFLNQNGADLHNDYIDTMRISRRLWPEEQHHRLRDLNERLLGGPNSSAHRSAADAEITALCYEFMRRYCKERNIDMVELGKPRPKHKFKVGEITTDKTDFNPDSQIYGKVFVFTGTLSMQRRDAVQLVVDNGGSCGDNVTAKTNFLVLGTQDYRKVGVEGKSSKQRKAEKLKLGGQDIEIISERVFLSMVDEANAE